MTYREPPKPTCPDCRVELERGTCPGCGRALRGDTMPPPVGSRPKQKDEEKKDEDTSATDWIRITWG